MDINEAYNVYKELKDYPHIIQMIQKVIEEYTNEYYDVNDYVSMLDYNGILDRVVDIAMIKASQDCLELLKGDLGKYIDKKYKYYNDLIKDTLTK